MVEEILSDLLKREREVLRLVNKIQVRRIDGQVSVRQPLRAQAHQGRFTHLWQSLDGNNHGASSSPVAHVVKRVICGKCRRSFSSDKTALPEIPQTASCMVCLSFPLSGNQ